MQIERLALVLRPRNAWEAVDLGMRMAASWWKIVYSPTVVFTLPLAVLLIGISFTDYRFGFLGPFIFWWLKPMYDRVALYVLGQRVFGDSPTVKQTLRAMPGLWRHSNLLRGLTWARLSPWRSLLMSVDLLEGLKGQEARLRRRVLFQRVGGTAVWLTVGLSFLESVLAFGLLLGSLVAFVPPKIIESFEWQDFVMGNASATMERCINISYAFVVMFISPIYTAAGFSLYLKRRSDLEAWDVEIQLRRLANAHQVDKTSTSTTTKAAAKVLTILLCASVFMSGIHGSAQAQTVDTNREKDVDQAQTKLDKVLSNPVFGGMKKQTTRQFVNKAGKKKSSDMDLGLFAKIVMTIAQIIRFAGWIILAVLIVLLLRLIIRNFSDWERTSKKFIPPAEIAGLDIRPESLPKDIPATVQRLIEAGKHREALSLLLRGALSVLAHQYHIPFTRGDTEKECLVRVKKDAPVMADYFSSLVAAWCSLAYAHLTVNVSTIQQLGLDWGKVFGKSGMGRNE